MMKKRLSKTVWYGSEVDTEGNPVVPRLAEGADDLEGLHHGELYLHEADDNLSLWARTLTNQIKLIGGLGGGGSLWKLMETESGEKYLFTEFNVVTQMGITSFADNKNLDLPGIYDGIPIDNQTLYWEESTDSEGNVVRLLKAKGGSGEDLGEYLPLSGGTLTGAVTSNTRNARPLTFNYTDGWVSQFITFKKDGEDAGYIGCNADGLMFMESGKYSVRVGDSGAEVRTNGISYEIVHALPVTSSLGDVQRLLVKNELNVPVWTSLDAIKVENAQNADYASKAGNSDYASKAGNASNADVAGKLSTIDKYAWGQKFWTEDGIPNSISGDMANVGNIYPMESGIYSVGSRYRLFENAFLKKATIGDVLYKTNEDGTELTINPVEIRRTDDGDLVIDGNLLVTGGITSFSDEGAGNQWIFNVDSVDDMTSTDPFRVYSAQSVSLLVSKLNNTLQGIQSSVQEIDSSSSLEDMRAALISIYNNLSILTNGNNTE